MSKRETYKNRLSTKNKVGRLAWTMVYFCMFRPFSSNIFIGWRNFWLRLFGAKIAPNAVVHASVSIWAPWNLILDEYATLDRHVVCYNVDMIEMGKHATVSQYSILCTASHDIMSAQNELITHPIKIGDDAWVAIGAYVGPGVTMGDGAVAAAKAVVVNDVEPWSVVGGNPAQFIKKREFVR